MTYPVVPPTEQITLLVGMLTGRTAPVLSEAAYAGWCAQGYLQGLLIGAPGAGQLTFAAASSEETPIVALSETELVAELEKLAGPTAAGPLDSIKAAILKQLLAQLQKWVLEWLAKNSLGDIVSRVQAV